MAKRVEKVDGSSLNYQTGYGDAELFYGDKCLELEDELKRYKNAICYYKKAGGTSQIDNIWENIKEEFGLK